MSIKLELKNRRRTLLFYYLFGAFCICILLFNQSEWYYQLSYIFTAYFFLSLIFELGKSFPFREITLFITSLQYLLSPTLDYKYLGEYTFLKMPIPPEVYFPYIIPAFIAIWVGLTLPVMRKRMDEAEMVTLVKRNPERNKKTGITLILVGTVFTVMQTLLNFSGIAFIVMLLSMLKYVGMVYIWLSDYRYAKVWIWGVMLMTAAEALNQAIFINLIFVGFLFFCFYSLFNRIHPMKSLLVSLLAATLLFFLQSVKKDYRIGVWKGKSEQGNFSFLVDLFSAKVTNMTEKDFLQSAALVNARVNQGWVLGLIMRHIPNRHPIYKGEIFFDELAGVALPRLFFSDKAVAQTSEKFFKLVGYKLRGYTIAVGLPGDGYGNFGVTGGIIFCFLIGMLFNLALSIFYRISSRKPGLFLWCILIFFYLMRAGDDFYIITNWILKSSIFVYIIYLFDKNSFRLKPPAWKIRMMLRPRIPQVASEN